MCKIKYSLTVIFLLFNFNVHAGWRDMAGGDKAALGLGLVDIALEGKRDKKAKAAATKTLESITYESVYSTEDCQTIYDEVLSSEQLESNKAWVGEITEQIDNRCEQVMPANNERRLAEEAKQRELDALHRIELEKQRVIAEKNRAANEKRIAREKYQEYRTFFNEKKAMTSASAIKNWKPLYDVHYKKMSGLANSTLVTANNAKKLAQAKKFAANIKKGAQELCECYQVNMAIAMPNAPVSDIKKIARATETRNSYGTPIGYDETLAMVFLKCADAPTNPDLF